MPNPYWAGIVLARYNHRLGRIELLLQDSEYVGGRRETKNPGGMEEPQDRGNPVTTARREVFQEANIRIRNHVKPKPLATLPGSNSPDRHFFLVWFGDCSGHVRTRPRDDGSDTRIIAHRWVSVEQYKREISTSSHWPIVGELEKMGW